MGGMVRGLLVPCLSCLLAGPRSVSGGLAPGFPSVQVKGVLGEMAMPLYGIGTWEYNDTKAALAVESAFAMGYRHVDTALIYNNHAGVGKALAKTGVPREEYFVTTKIPGGLNASATVEALDTCLTQLGLDYVDLMLIHFPDSFDGHGGAARRKEEWKTMEAWAKAGKARALGVSHYCKHQTQDVLDVATVPVAVNQVQYHVGMGSDGDKATDYRAWAQKQGILYESFSPLCGPCTPPDNMELINGSLVTEIGRAHNKTGAQVSLRWLVQQGIPVIPKSIDPHHLRNNMEIFDFTLSKEEMARLTAADKPPVGGGPGPQDSGDCGMEAPKEEMLTIAV